MIKIKLLADHFRDLWKKVLQILCLVDRARNLSNRFKLPGAIFIALICKIKFGCPCLNQFFEPGT